MTVSHFALSRRLVLKGFAVAAATAAAPSVALGQTRADAILLTISDLHAPYARLPVLLERIRALKADAGATPVALLVNGDIFERGNVVCLRSGGAADLMFLSEVAKEMPVVVNLGNHETAIFDDMQTFVAKASAAGAETISNLMDKRTGRFFTPAYGQLGLGGMKIGLLGLAAVNPFVYRPPVRTTLGFFDPAGFVAEAFDEAMAGADAKLIMSHAGVTPDRAFIDTLPEGTILQGAHDHLTFDLVRNGVTYFHGASWGTTLGIAEITKTADGVSTSYRTETIAPGAGDPALRELVEAQKSAHLTDGDKEVLAEIKSDRSMHDSILIAAEAIRQAADADVATIGHTTFGAPLVAGPLTKYDLDAFIRFGGGVSVTMVNGARLAEIFARGNQFRAAGLEGRTGDYIHVTDMDIDPGRDYRFVVNNWTAMNQKSYLGTDDLEFEKIDGIELKETVAAYLRDNG